MDSGGFNWTLLTIIGPAILAVVILYALLRNRSSRAGRERSEEATHRLYQQEEAERRDPDSDKGP
jgi:ribose 1,5-bisphosphokinase PhnN